MSNALEGKPLFRLCLPIFLSTQHFRAHLNDLENIPFFLVVALIYLLTGPPQHLAINLFRIYAVARISHTLVYTVFIMPQPTRALAYGVGWVVKAYMAFQSLLYFL